MEIIGRERIAPATQQEGWELNPGLSGLNARGHYQPTGVLCFKLSYSLLMVKINKDMEGHIFDYKKCYKGRRIMQNTIGPTSPNEQMVAFCRKLRNKT